MPGDPTQNIRLTEKVFSVMKDGVIYRNDIYRNDIYRNDTPRP